MDRQCQKCESCNLYPAVGVASLPFAAVSCAFCRDCLIHRCYPLWAVIGTIQICSGKVGVSEWFLDNVCVRLGRRCVRSRDIPEYLIPGSDPMLGTVYRIPADYRVNIPSYFLAHYE